MIEDKSKGKKKGRWAKKNEAKKKAKLHKPSYRKSARLRLQEMFDKGFGQKRSKDKNKGETSDKIYSKNTFKTYKNQFRYLGDWLEKTHPEVHTLEEAREYVDEYLTYLIDDKRSAWAIATAKSALAKVFQVESTQFIKTPPRERVNIKRSRVPAKRDKNISKKREARLGQFTSAFDLRREEMEMIEAEDLFFKNGVPYLKVTKGTKGGKHRIAKIKGITDEETRDLVTWIQSKKGRLFPTLSSNYDNHHYRAVYAMRLYKKHARPVNKIPKKERYVMRKERRGEVLDRVAMKIVSKNLGHNRIDVIAQSYLYDLDNY